MAREVYRVFEICEKDSLDKLCEVVLDAFDFDHDHLYEFCMEGKLYKDYNYQSNPERGQPSTRISLDKIRLAEKQKFVLHYDFGDDWEFVISVQKIATVPKYESPKTTTCKGEIEQYPNWDEDWEKDEDEDED